MTVSNDSHCLQLAGRPNLRAPIVWLGQSVRTTIVTKRYPSMAAECWMVSLGDAIHRPRLIDRVFCGDLRERLAVTGPIMLDSGGFTMMTKDRGLRVSDVAQIYSRTTADLCISLDVPTLRGDRRRTRARKYEETLTNLRQLIDCVCSSRLVPVVHGLRREEIVANCQLIGSLISRPKLVCIGGLVPLLRSAGKQSARRDRAFAWVASMVSTVKAYFPSAIIHVLGAGSPQTVAAVIQCGADSTDSLAWRRAAGFGTIFLPSTSERFIRPRDRKRAGSRPTLNTKELEMLACCECPACSEWQQVDRREAELAESYLARAVHNAFVVLADAKAAVLNRSNGALGVSNATAR